MFSSLNIHRDALLFLILFLVIISLILMAYAIRNEYRMRRLFKGNHISDLEQSLIKTESALKELAVFKEHTEKKIHDISVQVENGARKIGIVRFNPFGKKDGGNQSFAAAFVNKKGDGIVFSSLAIRDRVTFFAKPLRSDESEYELSPEERRAIKKAYEK